MQPPARSTRTTPPPLGAWGLVVVDDVPIVGGLDADASVWQVEDGSGDLWSVKATRRDCRFGLALAASLGGAPGVVAPLPTLAGELWSEHEGSMVSVSPWVLGDDAAEDGRGLDLGQWSELGAVVRRIHSQRPPAAVAPPRSGIKRAGRRARVRLRELDALLVDDGPSSAADPELTDLWRANRGRLGQLEATALRLKAERRPAPRVPCHGDPHLGNVVVDDGGRPWLIDLDEATVAPREVDLVLVELGVLPGLPVEPEHRAAFRAGYGDADLDEGRLIRFACVRALEDVTAAFSALEGAHSAQHDPDAVGVHAGLRDLLGPLGLVSLVEERLPAPPTPRAPISTEPTPGEPT